MEILQYLKNLNNLHENISSVMFWYYVYKNIWIHGEYP